MFKSLSVRYRINYSMHGIKVASNTIFQFLTKGITSAVGFIITILLAHFYGAQIYGEYTKITVFIGVFYILVDFGLNAVFLKQNEDDTGFKKLLALRLVISAALIILVNGLILLLPFNSLDATGFGPHMRIGIFIFSLTIFTQAVVYSATAIFQKRLNYKPYAVSVSVGALVLLILTTLVSVRNLPINYVYLSYLLAGMTTSLLCLILARIKVFPLRFDSEFSIKIITTGYPLGLMLFFNLVYFRFDIFILSLLTGATEVAVYGYAFKYFEFLLAIPVFMANSIYPFLLGSLKNLRRFRVFTAKYLVIFFVVSIAISVLFWFLSPLISIVKNEFIPSINILRALVIFLPIFFITGLLQWALIALGNMKYLLFTYILAALLNVILNINLIPSYGALGAAVVAGISEFTVMLLLAVKFLAVVYGSAKNRKIYES